MKIAAVKKLNPYHRFVYYMNERYAIRERRNNGELRPWTDDTILDTYKFTNVKRRWDRTSQWLITNWYQPYGSRPTAGLATVTARFICFQPSLELIGFPSIETNAWLKRAEFKLHDRARSGHKVFTSAYMIAGGSSEGRSKVEWVFNDVIQPAWKSGLLTDKWKGTAMALHNELRTLNNFGDFMTQEVILDLMETYVLADAPDRQTYGMAGPGALRGLKRVAGVSIEDRLNRTDAREQMVLLWETLRESGDLDSGLRPLTVHDVEFCLCEFDKFERVLWGEGTPKQLFKSYDGGLGL